MLTSLGQSKTLRIESTIRLGRHGWTHQRKEFTEKKKKKKKKNKAEEIQLANLRV